jgi:uncharacterized protein (TIGR03437 family)
LKRLFPIFGLCFILLVALNLNAQSIAVDKSSLSFAAQVNALPVSQTLNITSSSATTQIPWSAVASSTPAWLKVNGLPNLTGGTPAAVTVSADPTNLNAGNYSGSIAITGFGAIWSTVVVQVSFAVTTIGLSQQSVQFQYQIAGSIPLAQTITLSGSASYSALASTSSGGAWLQLSAPNGASPTVSGLSPGTLTVLPNASVISGLAAGTYNGTITITPAPAGSIPQINVPVTLAVLPTPPVTFSSTALVFNSQISGANNQTQQTLQLTTTSPSTNPVTCFAGNPIVDPTNTGRNWLTVSVSPTSFSASTPCVITVNVDPTGLNEKPSGWNGTFSVLTSGVPSTQTVSVKLVVSISPLLNAPSGPLTFTYQFGANAPGPQNVKITSTNAAPDATTGQIPLTIAVASGAPWLSAPTTGITGTNFAVSVTPSGFAPGKYNSLITVSGNGAANGPLTIPVTLTVMNDPIIVATANGCSTLTQPCPMIFAAQTGQNTPAQRIQVTSSTGTPLSYVATPSQAACTGTTWLTLNENTTSTTNGSFTASVNPAGIAAGTQCTGSISIAGVNPATTAATPNSPLVIPVTLYVSSTPLLVVTPTAVAFTAQQGANSAQGQNCQGPNPLFCTISVSSTSLAAAEQLKYSAAFIPPTGVVDWLLVSPQGVVNTAAGATSTVTLSANPAGLIAGSYQGTLRITATDLSGVAVADSPINIPISLHLNSATMTLSASSLSFTQPANGAAPAAQTITVTSSGTSGGTQLTYTAVAANPGTVSWLSVTQASSPGATPGTITVNADGSRLSAGTYTGSVTIVSTTAFTSGSPAVVNVTLTVTPGTISADKAALTFTQAVGGAAPAAQTITVSGSPSALSFTVLAAADNNGTWLKTPTVSGSSTPATVSVSVDAGALPVGSYKGNVTVTSAGSTGSPITIPVTLNVVASQTLTVTPVTVNFTYFVGQPAPASQTVQISASANTTYSTQVSSSATWLQVAPATGNVPGSLSITVNPAGLTTAGNLTGTITVSSPAAAQPAIITVNLAVQVVPPPKLTVLQNAASGIAGAISPGEIVAIGGTGIGPSTPALGTVTNGVVDNKIGDTQVMFDNVPAPILYASSTQTNVIVPYQVAGRATTTVRVYYKDVPGDPVTYNVTATAPAIFTINQQGNGPGAILNQDGRTTNSSTAPEQKGNVVSVFMTGEGVVPGNLTGAIATGLRQPLLPVTATIGGISAVVNYYGTSPGLVNGAMQVNLVIPPTAPSGNNVPIAISVGGVPAQGGVTVAVQ